MHVDTKDVINAIKQEQAQIRKLIKKLDADDNITLALLHGEKKGLSKAIQLLESAPSADVRGVKHAHWIVTGRTNVYGGMEVTCSECGDTLMIQYLELEHFCRNCGADMDGCSDFI